ncbi:hypothetical protein ScalyP_jg3926 [Parmales sp. scaly parma]|nr:hypothetical protein ScalyP_jg3926 [Parmales sp. scaly parma]
MASLIDNANNTHSLKSLISRGVPKDDAPDVLKLALHLNIKVDQNEPICDPLTLMRFNNARESNLLESSEMYNKSIAWRGTVFPRVSDLYGSGPNKKQATDRASTVYSHSCFGVLGRTTEVGEPIAVWQFGAIDMAGISKRELFDDLCECYMAHLEDVLQAGRAASIAQGKLVRARIVICASGITVGKLMYIKMIKKVLAIGKMYFPELTKSVTIVNAPWVFAKFYALISPALTPVMRKKVCILDTNFDEKLLAHAGFSRKLLPICLGGDSSDDQLPPCLPVNLN